MTMEHLVAQLTAGQVEPSEAARRLAERKPGRSEGRRLFAQLAMKSGLPISLIQTALGHKQSGAK